MNTDKFSETKTKKPPTTAKGQEAALLSDILQLPEPRFRGRIGNTYADSEADIISLPTAPAGAPNTLVILLDDVGLGHTSTFGGPLHVLMREDVSETTFEDWVTQHQTHAIRGGDTMSHLLDRRKMLLVSFVCALLFVLHFASPYARGQAAPPAKGQAAAAPLVQYQPWTGDFDGMLQRRFIRVLVSSSKTQYYVVHGVQHGSSYEYFKEFEQWVNLKYPPKVKNARFHVVFVPVPRDQMFPRLAAGKGDLAVGALTITPARFKLVDLSDPLVTDVKEIAVTGPRSPVIHSLDDLSGQEVFVRKSSSYWEHLEALNSRLKSPGKASVKLRAAPEDLEDEDLLEMLNAGLIPVVVTNAYLPNLLQKIYTNIRPVPEAVLDDSGQIAWAMRRNSPKLAGVINQFVNTHKQGAAFGNAVIGRYALNPKMLKNAVAPAELRKFQETVSFFQKYAAEYNVDYLLMMAQVFRNRL
jgi:ABC-type amino acid transport substrate-binding protein